MDVPGLFANVGASATAAIASKLATYPLDTIAVQYQTSTARPLLSTSLRGYYRGIGVVLLTVTPATAVYLTTREATHTALSPRLGDTFLNDALSGCAAEVASSVLFTPMEVLKARFQISHAAEESKLGYQLRDIYKKEGIRGFYRGYTMGIASYIPYNIIWWTTYGGIRRNMSDENPKLTIACSAGGAAALSAGFINPLELVKTRYQVATSGTVAAVAEAGAYSRSSDKDGMMQVVRNVMKESGLKGFYAGFIPAVLKSIPSAVITMIVFESLKAKKKDDFESTL